MNITDADGLWRITDGQIESRKTGKVRQVGGIPANSLASMDYRAFLHGCNIGFNTGHWPGTKECSLCSQIIKELG